MPPKFDPTEIKKGIFLLLFQVLKHCDNNIILSSSHMRLSDYIIIIFSVILRCVGGEIGATSTLARKIGPLVISSDFHLSADEPNIICYWGDHLNKKNHAVETSDI